MKKIIKQAPITISIVVICDTRILVKEKDGSFYFPSDYLSPGEEACQECASAILKEITEIDYDINKWVPVDIRSVNRVNEDGFFTVDIGYMTILDYHDLPALNNNYKWQEVNLDNPDFPIMLSSDYGTLWANSYSTFSLICR